MIAAKLNTLTVNACVFCNAVYKRHEIAWAHSGVAAILVHLIAGRFNYNRSVQRLCPQQRRQNNIRLR